jgi:hypothetical protein
VRQQLTGAAGWVATHSRLRRVAGIGQLDPVALFGTANYFRLRCPLHYLMLLKILMACLLVAIAAVLKVLFRSHALASFGFWSSTWLMINLTGWLILVHLAEIAIWGLFYFWQGCLPDAESAFYFAGVTYTTIGYGDLVLTRPWRMFAPIEALTGILMCGVSTSAFFAVLIRRIDNWVNAKSSSEPKPP